MFIFLPIFALSHEVNKNDSAYWELLDSKVLLAHCSFPQVATEHYLSAVSAYRAGDYAEMEKELELMRADWIESCKIRLFAPVYITSLKIVSAHYERLPLEQF